MEPEFTFEPGVLTDQQELIREAIAMGNRFFLVNGLGDAGKTTVIAYTTFDCLVQAIKTYAAQHHYDIDEVRPYFWDTLWNSEACAFPEAIFVNTSNTGWKQGLAHERFQAIIHEYVHVLQRNLTGIDLESLAAGPCWLTEGSAEHIGGKVVADKGLSSFIEIQDTQAVLARSSAGRSLHSLETYEAMMADVRAHSWRVHHPLTFVAVDFLLTSTSNELSSLSSFWRDIGQRTTWQTAFQSVFGRSIEVFYAEFEEYRRVHLPPVPCIRGTVTNATDTPVAGFHIWARSVSLSVFFGYAITGADGTFTIPVREGTYLLQVARTSDGATDPRGYYSPTGLTLDPSKASVITISTSDVSDINVQIL